MHTVEEIRAEMNRLDKISGINTKNIPIRISNKMCRTIGKCVYCYSKLKPGEFVIDEFVFSKAFMERTTQEHFFDTVRHEYAHAYVILKEKKEDGHGACWQQAIRMFGGTPSATANFSELKGYSSRKKKYSVICCGCNHVFKYSKRTKIIDALISKRTDISFFCPYCHGEKFELKID